MKTTKMTESEGAHASESVLVVAHALLVAAVDPPTNLHTNSSYLYFQSWGLLRVRRSVGVRVRHS
jgi:hypothetical protein